MLSRNFPTFFQGYGHRVLDWNIFTVLLRNVETLFLRHLLGNLVTLLLWYGITLFLRMRGRNLFGNVIATLFGMTGALCFLVVAVSNLVTALLIGRGALFIIDGLISGGIAYPTLLIVHGGAVLSVPRLVNRLAFGVIIWFALGFHGPLKRCVVNSFALAVTDSAAPLLEEGVVDCAVHRLVASAALWPVAVVVARTESDQKCLKTRKYILGALLGGKSPDFSIE